jgi:hypothetical protein
MSARSDERQRMAPPPAPPAPLRRRTPPGRRAAWLVGFGTLILLAGAATWRSCPFLPGAITLGVTFPHGIADAVEPLMCTGIHGRSDFVVVKYLSETSAVLHYESWGAGGPTSAPFSFSPGQRQALRIEMPALAETGPVRPRERRPLRITLDGDDVLTGDVRFHRREPWQLYFGENPIGGNWRGHLFRGTLATEDGRVLGATWRDLFPWPERLGFWLRTQPWHLIAVLLASIAAGLATGPALAWRAAHPLPRQPMRVFAARTRPPHRWFALTALLCTAAFGTFVTHGTLRFVFPEEFGSFYDHQAASLLQGRLDVPESALGGESFIVDGRYYGYFGITPAILRLPFVASGVAFGELSRLYMTGYFLACLVAAYALLCHATRLLCGTGAWPSGWAVVAFILPTGLGSSLLFLGSSAYLYHEAILCGAALALWTIVCSLRYLHAPESRWWIPALVCGLLAIHARPSSGLFALCTVGTVALVHLLATHRAQRMSGWRRHLGVGLLAAAAILSFNGMSYLKFGSFGGSPFRYSVQYTPDRIAKFEGRNFHLSNLRHNIDVYLLRPDVYFRPRFPYVFPGATQPPAYPNARIDLEEPTLALPYAMPALFALAVAGGAWAFLAAPVLRVPLTVLAVAVAPMALALFTAIVTSHRYTGDFCPILIACGASGLAVLDADPTRWRRAWLALTSALAAASVVLTFLVSVHFQGEVVWGTPEDGKQNYERLRQAVDGFFGTGQRADKKD